MIDVDNFKLVNDTYGHVVGNKVLTQIAKTIERTVRNTDFVFRCGGDEFGVVLPATDLDGAMRTAQKVLAEGGVARHSDHIGLFGSCHRKHRHIRVPQGKPFRNPRRRSRPGALCIEAIVQELRPCIQGFNLGTVAAVIRIERQDAGRCSPSLDTILARS